MTTTAWHIAADHDASYQAGISLSLADLLHLEQGRRVHAMPRYVRARHEGNAPSKQKGRGMDYAESRQYQAGDEVRHVDWRLTARSGRLHTKVFHVERERPVFLLLDQRPAMFFGSRIALKSVTAARLCAQALWTHLAAGDRVGLVRADERSTDIIKPSPRRRDAVALLARIVAAHQSLLAGPVSADLSTELSTDTAPATADDAALLRAFAELRRLLTPGALVIAVADLMTLPVALEPLLSDIARRGELRLYGLYDPLEARLPDGGRYQIGAGSQVFSLQRGPSGRGDRVQKRYTEQFYAQQLRWQQFAQSHGLQWLALSNQDGIAHGYR